VVFFNENFKDYFRLFLRISSTGTLNHSEFSKKWQAIIKAQPPGTINLGEGYKNQIQEEKYA
jgi:hypothetical protein